jgi:hypothetical protein
MNAIIPGIIILCCLLTGIACAEASTYENWTQITSNASFSPRESPGVTVFDNRLWVIGGNVPNSLTNDVWSSTDGNNWTLEAEHAGFSPRTYHSVVTFNNRLWVIGGGSFLGYTNDVWSSTDGRNWTLETEHAAFSPRLSFGVAVFNNRLWVVGGSHLEEGNEISTNDVWSSTDGKTWNLETEHANFSPRYGTGVVATDNQLWMLAGNSTSDVWSSADGKTWTLINGNAPFCSTDNNRVIVFRDRIFVVGTCSSGHGVTNDVWSSADGVTWTVDRVYVDFGTRPFNKVVAFKNGLWAIAGFDSLNTARAKNDVWYMPLPVPSLTSITTTHLPPIPHTTGSAVPETTTTKAGSAPLIVCIGLCVATGICSRYVRRRLR